MRGDYSAPRDLECVSNRLARSTHDPGTSLTTNTYRYIITRQGSSYRYIASQLSAFFTHEACSSLERNVSLLFRHDAETMHFPLTRRVSRFRQIFLIPIFSFNNLPIILQKKKFKINCVDPSPISSRRISFKKSPILRARVLQLIFLNGRNWNGLRRRVDTKRFVRARKGRRKAAIRAKGFLQLVGANILMHFAGNRQAALSFSTWQGSLSIKQRCLIVFSIYRAVACLVPSIYNSCNTRSTCSYRFPPVDITIMILIMPARADK